MARSNTKSEVQPTFYIKDEASMEEFMSILGIKRPERGGLPMITVMRTAADQSRAFTIDGYRPSEAPVSSTAYTIVFKAPPGASHPGGEGTVVLTLDKVRELVGAEKGRGRTSVATFASAVAAHIGEDPDYVKAVSVIGDAPGARDLCVPVTRKSEDGKETTVTEDAEDGETAETSEPAEDGDDK